MGRGVWRNLNVEASEASLNISASILLDEILPACDALVRITS